MSLSLLVLSSCTGCGTKLVLKKVVWMSQQSDDWMMESVGGCWMLSGQMGGQVGGQVVDWVSRWIAGWNLHPIESEILNVANCLWQALSGVC